MNDDVEMVKLYFTKNKEYFDLRNHKYETVFHIAAKHNSVQSLKAMLGQTVFIEEMLKRDFKGDTPMHAAAKAGSLEIMEFFLSSVSYSFLEI